MRAVAIVAAALLGVLGACTHNVAPKVTPAKVAAVEPPIRANALLLITPAFENYVTTQSEGIHKYVYHMGESAAGALGDMVNASFQRAEVRHVGDAELMQWLSGPADTTLADLLLVPRFDVAEKSSGAFSQSSDVRLRLDVRLYRGTTTYSWGSFGHTSRFLSSQRGLTGSALEQALNGLVDSLRTYRMQLEVKSP